LIGHQYGTARPRKKIRYARIRQLKRNLWLKPDLDWCVFLPIPCFYR
jgi:hypothetical protein